MSVIYSSIIPQNTSNNRELITNSLETLNKTVNYFIEELNKIDETKVRSITVEEASLVKLKMADLEAFVNILKKRISNVNSTLVDEINLKIATGLFILDEKIIKANKRIQYRLKKATEAPTLYTKRIINTAIKLIRVNSSTPRSKSRHTRVSNPSKSIQGEGGDSGDPDPARPKSFVIPFHHQLPRISKLNRFLFSWLSSKSCCSMDWRRAA